MRAYRHAPKKHRRKECGNVVSGLKSSAAVLLLIGTISFAVLMSIPTVRAAAYDSVVKFYEKYFSFEYRDSQSPTTLGNVTLGYIPQGFALADSFESIVMSKYIFENDAGERFSLYYGDEEMVSPQYDSEHTDLDSLEISGITVYLIRHEGTVISAVWNDGRYTYCIDGAFDYSDLKKFIENIS